jgi:hypothetical protein
MKYQGKLYVLNLRATSAEKTWLLLVNVIQKFRKAVQMSVPPGGTQTIALKVATSEIPVSGPGKYFAHHKKMLTSL